MALIALSFGTMIPANSQAYPKVPPGILEFTTITITNNQPVPTPAPFQQMLVMDMSAFCTDYTNSHLQNVEFFSQDGSIIPSWLESGASNSSTATTYWLKLADGIPADSAVTVYMGCSTSETNFFNTQTTGEAPELSVIYGEYDDGSNVFSAYYDMGSNPVVSVNVPQGGVYSVESSIGPLGSTQPILQWTGYSGGNELALFPSTPLPPNLAITAWVKTNSQPFDIGLGVTASSSQYNGYFVDPGEGYNANFAIWSSSSEPSNNGWAGILQSVPYSMSPDSWYTLELQLLGNTLTGYVEPFQNTLDASSSSATVSAGISQSQFDTVMLAPYANSASQTTEWALVVARALPPNGIMPTASGSFVASPTSQSQTTSFSNTHTTTTPLAAPFTALPVNQLALSFAIPIGLATVFVIAGKVAERRKGP